MVLVNFFEGEAKNIFGMEQLPPALPLATCLLCWPAVAILM